MGGCHGTVDNTGNRPAGRRLQLLRQLHRPVLRLLRQLQITGHGGQVVGFAGTCPSTRNAWAASVVHSD
jgi:hypothetical protein